MPGNEAETQQVRIDLAAVLRTTARLGMHEGVCNHISVMLDRLSPTGRRCFLINPKGTAFERITASRLLVIDEDGVTLEGAGRAPTSGFAIHTRVHLAHPQGKVVMHLHSPYATSLTALKAGRLLMVHQNSTRFFGEIAYDDHFNGIAEATREGDRMAQAMGPKPILFLANHGVVVVRNTLAHAFDDFYYLERACQVQVLAMQMQGTQGLNIMPDTLAQATHDQFANFTINAELHLEESKRILDETAPDYAS